MNESQLKTLLWVARLGGIGAAAKHLHMTQPAITRRIQELERELGAPVLRRDGRNVVPCVRDRSTKRNDAKRDEVRYERSDGISGRQQRGSAGTRGHR